MKCNPFIIPKTKYQNTHFIYPHLFSHLPLIAHFLLFVTTSPCNTSPCVLLLVFFSLCSSPYVLLLMFFSLCSSPLCFPFLCLLYSNNRQLQSPNPTDVYLDGSLLTQVDFYFLTRPPALTCWFAPEKQQFQWVSVFSLTQLRK